MSKSIPERVSSLEADMDNTKQTIERLMEINDRQLIMLNKLSRLVWMGMGAVVVIQFIVNLVIPFIHK